MRILSWLWRREKKAWLTPLVDWAFCCCLTSDACTSHTPAPAHDKNVGQQHVWSRVFFVFLQYPKTYLRLCVWKVFGDWNWRVDTLCASQLTNNTIIELLSCLIGLDGRLDWFECVIGMKWLTANVPNYLIGSDWKWGNLQYFVCLTGTHSHISYSRSDRENDDYKSNSTVLPNWTIISKITTSWWTTMKENSFRKTAPLHCLHLANDFPKIRNQTDFHFIHKIQSNPILLILIQKSTVHFLLLLRSASAARFFFFPPRTFNTHTKLGKHLKEQNLTAYSGVNNIIIARRTSSETN